MSPTLQHEWEVTTKEASVAKKGETLMTVKVDKFPATLWHRARAAAALDGGKSVRDWLAEAVREKLERSKL